MKTRRHHNNKGHRQIKNGATRKFVARLAWKLNVPSTRNVVEDAIKTAKRLPNHE